MACGRYDGLVPTGYYNDQTRIYKIVVNQTVSARIPRMSNPLSSLSLLGLSPSGFRLVSEEEMAPDADHGASRHGDGTECRCEWECSEVIEAEFQTRNAHLFS